MRKPSDIKKLILRIFISLLVSGYLLSKIDFQELISIVFHWGYLPLLFGTLLSSYFIRAIFYKETIGSQEATVRPFFLVTGLYNFLSSMIPFGLGHLSYPFFLKKYYGILFSKGLSSLIQYNLIRVIIISIFFFAAIHNLNILKYFGVEISKIYFFAGIICSAILIALLLKLKFFNKLNRCKYISSALFQIIIDTRINLLSKKTLRLVFYSLAVFVFNIASIFFSYTFLGYSLSVMEAVLVTTIVNLSSLLPIHGIGQFGTCEAINSVVLRALGFPLNEAIQISFSIHIVALGAQAVIALPCYLVLRPVDKPAVSIIHS